MTAMDPAGSCSELLDDSIGVDDDRRYVLAYILG